MQTQQRLQLPPQSIALTMNMQENCECFNILQSPLGIKGEKLDKSVPLINSVIPQLVIHAPKLLH